MSYDKRTGWQVGDNFFTNKWYAIQYAMANPQHAYRAYCQDSNWDKADWSVEPQQDIKQLEKQHAENLRNKYKTLGLCYSGGVDSSTVLKTFIDNQIPLDYIFVWYVNDHTVSYNKDVQLAMQYLKQHQSKLMGAKIIYGKKLDHLEGNSIYNFQKDIRNTNWQLRFHHLGHEENLKQRRSDIYYEIKENGCIITGSNKPYVYKDQKGFYVQYVDYDDENWGQPLLEMFWQGANPTLQIKQGHLAKRWLQENDLSNANTVYKSKDTNKFWSLNQSIGRSSIDKFFYNKNCFGEQIDDQFFGQHFNSSWGNSYFAEHFKNWHNTDSYTNLIAELNKFDKKFVDNCKAFGWLTHKRYLG